MARLDVLHSAVEDAPADGLLDKLREVAFFHARGAEISAQRKVDFPGDLDIPANRSEEHTSELQSRLHLACRLLLEKKKKRKPISAMGLSLRTPGSLENPSIQSLLQLLTPYIAFDENERHNRLCTFFQRSLRYCSHC